MADEPAPAPKAAPSTVVSALIELALEDSGGKKRGTDAPPKPRARGGRNAEIVIEDESDDDVPAPPKAKSAAPAQSTGKNVLFLRNEWGFMRFHCELQKL